MDIQDTLKERGSRYGDFKAQSIISQSFKIILHNEISAKGMTSDKVEALEMIFSKIARIINGDPDYKDSWVDIAGYATLVANTLKDEK